MLNTLKQSDLEQFTGTEQWYRHALSGYLYTDGIKFLADQAKAYWLIDKILILTRYKQKLQEFGSWKLHVKEDKTATLICEDGDKKVLYTEKIDYTDFPLENVSLWFQNETLILPSEY